MDFEEEIEIVEWQLEGVAPPNTPKDPKIAEVGRFFSSKSVNKAPCAFESGRMSFGEALARRNENLNLFCESWGGGGKRTGMKKRNAREAELVEFQEIGTDPQNVDLGYNGAKIRTVDFEDEGSVVKNGYLVEAEGAGEDEEWEASLAPSCGDLFGWRSVETEERSKELRGRRTKVGKRRGRLEEEDWEKDSRLVWEEIFGLPS